jgi:hypothetical protein
MVDYRITNFAPDSDSVKIEVLDGEHVEITISISKDENGKVWIHTDSEDDEVTLILGEDGMTQKG